MKNCFVYEDLERAKDAYNKLMRVCINLDSEIMALSLNLGNLEVSTDYSDLDYESIETERRYFDKRLEEFDEDVLINEESKLPAKLVVYTAPRRREYRHAPTGAPSIISTCTTFAASA